MLDQPGSVIITNTIGEEEITIGKAIGESSDVGLPDSESMRLLQVFTILRVKEIFTPWEYFSKILFNSLNVFIPESGDRSDVIDSLHGDLGGLL